MIRDYYHEKLGRIGARPKGWTTGSVKIQLIEPKEKVSVEAWLRGNFAVHRAKDNVGIVTHVPTGLRIGTCANIQEATIVVHSIEVLTDWSKKDKKSYMKIESRVLAIIKESSK